MSELATIESNYSLTWTPFQGSDEITLGIEDVLSITTPTKKKFYPSDSKIREFLNVCKTCQLNPWVKDAYLVGYDGKDGPEFNVITGIQAMWKRAEAHELYDGTEYGVIVCPEGKEDEAVHLEGEFVPRTKVLLGAWARCHMKGRKVPFYNAINLEPFKPEFYSPTWNKNAAGMICKVACASVLRKAFPSVVGGMRIEEEEPAMRRSEVVESVVVPGEKPKDLQQLVGAMKSVQAIGFTPELSSSQMSGMVEEFKALGPEVYKPRSKPKGDIVREEVGLVNEVDVTT